MEDGYFLDPEETPEMLIVESPQIGGGVERSPEKGVAPWWGVGAPLGVFVFRLG